MGPHAQARPKPAKTGERQTLSREQEGRLQDQLAILDLDKPSRVAPYLVVNDVDVASGPIRVSESYRRAPLIRQRVVLGQGSQ